jgi:hypothetical protein
MCINGAAVYRMENLRKMLKEEEYSAQFQFSRNAQNLSYTLVFPRKPGEEHAPERGSPVYCIHVGSDRASSTHRAGLCQGESYV